MEELLLAATTTAVVAVMDVRRAITVPDAGGEPAPESLRGRRLRVFLCERSSGAGPRLTERVAAHQVSPRERHPSRRHRHGPAETHMEIASLGAKRRLLFLLAVASPTHRYPDAASHLDDHIESPLIRLDDPPSDPEASELIAELAARE